MYTFMKLHMYLLAKSFGQIFWHARTWPRSLHVQSNCFTIQSFHLGISVVHEDGTGAQCTFVKDF